MAFLANRAKQKADKKKMSEKLNAKREANIANKEAKWRARADKAIFALKEAHEEYLDNVDQRREDARTAKQAKKDAERDAFLRKKSMRDDLEANREELEAERATKRLVKELSRVDLIKQDAEDELRSFLNNPAPVPLKQVLAGRLRPVPKVTELLAAHMDQRESLEDLKTADLPMRALLAKKSLFEYIREIQAEQERVRMKNKPPEPVVGDMGRGARSKSHGRRSPRSPQSARKKSPQRRRVQ